jgi:hypothetical protein
MARWLDAPIAKSAVIFYAFLPWSLMEATQAAACG